MAAGKAKRWTGEKPKQLTEFDGEALLYRTIRLLAEAGMKDITVTVSEELLSVLDIPRVAPATVFQPVNNVQEIDRFLSCREIWGDDTLFLYGDAYYTRGAISQILGNFATPITFYGRRRGNNVKPYGEMFALRVLTKDYVFQTCCNFIRDEEISGRKRGLGWDVYREYGKVNFVELDPHVEDFDKVEEVIKYKKLYGIA